MLAGLEAHEIHPYTFPNQASCTLGFGARRPGRDLLGNPVTLYGNFTAGHCTNDYRFEWWHDGHLLGQPEWDYVGNGTDGAVIGPYDAPSQSSYDTNRIWVGEGRSRIVVSVGLRGARSRSDSLDSVVCYSGVRTGTKCGRITQRNAHGVMEMRDGSERYLRYMREMTRDCFEGDSGGPIYQIRPYGKAVAVGIVSYFRGGLEFPHHFDCGYSHIGNILETGGQPWRLNLGP